MRAGTGTARVKRPRLDKFGAVSCRLWHCVFGNIVMSGESL